MPGPRRDAGGPGPQPRAVPAGTCTNRHSRAIAHRYQRIACWIAGTPILDSAGQITGTNYTPGVHGPLHLGLIDSRTEQLKALAPVESEWTYYVCWPDDPPIWSPDSAHLVYQDQDMDWWLVSLSTLRPRRLTEGLKNIAERSGLVWSPDSRYLALITPERILILEP